MPQHRPPGNLFRSARPLRGRVGNFPEVEKGGGGQNQARPKEHTEGGGIIGMAQKPGRQGNGEQQGGLGGRLIQGKETSADRLGHDRTDPGKVTAQGDTPDGIEEKKQEEHERLPGKVVDREGQDRHQHQPGDEHTPGCPTPQHKVPVPHLLHKTGRGDLENVEQRRQGGQHPQHRGGCAQFLEIQHHGQAHHQVERTGVENLKQEGVQEGPAHEPAVFHAPESRGRSKGKKITSRIESVPASNIAKRSTPSPRPPAGGMPLSKASRNS